MSGAQETGNGSPFPDSAANGNRGPGGGLGDIPSPPATRARVIRDRAAAHWQGKSIRPYYTEYNSTSAPLAVGALTVTRFAKDLAGRASLPELHANEPDAKNQPP